MLQPRDIGAVMQAVDIGGRMPGRSRCELVALQQNDIAPAQFGQVIKDLASDDAPADHDGLCMGFHFRSLDCCRLPCAPERTWGSSRSGIIGCKVENVLPVSDSIFRFAAASPAPQI